MKTHRRRILPVIAVLIGWTIMAVLFTPQHYVISRQNPSPPHWSLLLLNNLIMFGIWAVLTPAGLWVGRRFPLERPRLARHLLYLFVAGFVLSLLHVAGVRYMSALITWSPPRPWFNYLVAFAATGVLIAWAILAASQALTYFRRLQDREVRLVQAQLQSLKSQLHPHFLFNALNAIAELAHGDAARAERTVTQLSDLLRTALSREGSDQVTLKEELDFIHNYLDIQQTLLQERLVTQWRVEDDTLDAQVPSMLLQPIVENAIQHGIAPIASGGRLEIAARRDGGRLVLQVIDDGRGIGDGPPAGHGGIGLANTRARLRHVYKDAHRFDIRPREGGGTIATFEIPLRLERSELPGEEID